MYLSDARTKQDMADIYALLNTTGSTWSPHATWDDDIPHQLDSHNPGLLFDIVFLQNLRHHCC